MSGSDAYEDEMRIFSSIGDRDQDRVLAGRTEAVGDDLRELAAFCQEARALFVNAPSESTAVRHLAEIAAAARHGVPAAPARARRRAPFASVGTRLALAGAGGALLAAFAGGALAGVLPGALQDKVAGIARNVGLSLPGSSTHPPPIDTGSRPKADPATPSAGLGGAGAANTETAKSGSETTRSENDQTTQSEGAPITRGAGDQTTENEGSKTSKSSSDGAIQGNGDQTTQPGVDGSAPDSTDDSRQPSASESVPTSGGSQPEGDSIPSDGGSPALPDDTPSGRDPAAPVIPAAPASPGDDGG